MNLLAIETSGPTSSVALCREEGLIASRAFPSRMSLCQNLVAEIEAVLAYLPGGEELGAVAVSLGPGSFTSLRIGIVTAKALAHQRGIALAGVPTMESLAAPFAHERSRAICVLQPAWKTRLYLAIYRSEASRGLQETTPPIALEPEGVLDHLRELRGPMLLVGEAAREYEGRLSEALGERAAFAPASLWAPRASLVAGAAWRRLSTAAPDAAYHLRPLYVVPSQAERMAGIDLGLTGTDDGV